MAASVRADKLVIKDEQGLPIIPGKTIKGLLRDAAQQLHQLDPERITSTFIQKVFGAKEGDDAADKAASKYHFTTATLSPKIVDSVRTGKLQSQLYDTYASTRIDTHGLAQDQSLRTIELVVPLVLYGQIIGFPADQVRMKQQLKDTMHFVKRMGTNRHRGLGRCSWTIINETEKSAS